MPASKTPSFLMGRNVKAWVEGSVLTLNIDMSEDHGPSKTGKSINIASTGGASVVAGPDGTPVSVNLNVYRKAGQ